MRRASFKVLMIVLAGIGTGALGLAPAAVGAEHLAAPVPAAPSAATFQAFVEAFRPEAEQRGITRAVYDAAFAGLAPDPSVAAMTRTQPEFVKPIGAYLAAQVTPSRVATGRAKLEQWSAVLDAIEHRTGVPRAIVIAIWGLETNYGTSTGGKDAIRSIATLAAMDYRPSLYRAELMSALTLLQAGDVRREDLRGSWAGAMGQPQFMPSSFAKYAVDQDGDGRRDIWASVPDSLASIANFIRQQGWQAGLPWGFEVRIPAGFDYRLSRGSYKDWIVRGLMRADGEPLPETGEGILFFPAGAAGPAFLVTENFEVLKTYNFSDAYVLGVAQLADRINGLGPVKTAWPSAPSMTRNNRIALQARLVALGYPVDNREGRISLALRDVIRIAQVRSGQLPDGNPTDRLLTALDGSRRDQ